MMKVIVKVDLVHYLIESVDVKFIIIFQMNLKNILSIVSNETNISISDIKSESKKGKLSDARKLYCVLAKEYTRESFNEIGKLINRDHSTVLYSEKKAKIFIKNEIKFRTIYNSIKERLN